MTPEWSKVITKYLLFFVKVMFNKPIHFVFLRL
jgi:hypothetical protein